MRVVCCDGHIHGGLCPNPECEFPPVVLREPGETHAEYAVRYRAIYAQWEELRSLPESSIPPKGTHVHP